MVDRLMMSRHGLPAGIVRLEVVGEVDMLVAAELTAVQLREIEDPVVAGVVVDLHQVRFLDSTGVAALVAGMRAAGKRGIPFTITNAHRMVRSVLELTGVLDALTGCDGAPSRSTAVGEASGGGR